MECIGDGTTGVITDGITGVGMPDGAGTTGAGMPAGVGTPDGVGTTGAGMLAGVGTPDGVGMLAGEDTTVHLDGEDTTDLVGVTDAHGTTDTAEHMLEILDEETQY